MYDQTVVFQHLNPCLYLVNFPPCGSSWETNPCPVQQSKLLDSCCSSPSCNYDTDHELAISKETHLPWSFKLVTQRTGSPHPGDHDGDSQWPDSQVQQHQAAASKANTSVGVQATVSSSAEATVMVHQAGTAV